jgi:hypothetical protein
VTNPFHYSKHQLFLLLYRSKYQLFFKNYIRKQYYHFTLETKNIQKKWFEENRIMNSEVKRNDTCSVWLYFNSDLPHIFGFLIVKIKCGG